MNGSFSRRRKLKQDKHCDWKVLDIVSHTFDGKTLFPVFSNLHLVLKIMPFGIHIFLPLPWYKSVAFNLLLLSMSSLIQF